MNTLRGRLCLDIVPLHKQLMPLSIRQQGNVREALIGVGDNTFKHCLKMPAHPDDSCSIKQVCVILKSTYNTIRFLF